jgi:integrase
VPKRRANGEGSVYKLKSGTWRASCPGGTPSFRGSTRDEAIRRREAYLRTNRHIVVLPKQARDSFAALLKRWLDSRRPSLRPRTIESYHDTATRYIIPAIGDIPIGRLTAEDIEKAMSKGKSPRTRNYIRSICHLALEFAMDRDLILRNVARKVSPVASASPSREMPSFDQWEALKGAIADQPIPTRALLLVLTFSGLRVGEVCGLRWPDYVAGELHVARAADREGNLVAVKTKAGTRTVPVGKLAAAALDVWREEQAKLRKKHARRWKDAPIDDLIFTTRYGSQWNQRNVLRAAHRVTEKAGMGKKSVHYLRHLAISHLISDPDVDIKMVQTIAGHSSIRVTLDTYGHLIPGRLHKAAEAMDRKS